MVKGMPQSVFTNRFGYDMQNDIYDCMMDFMQERSVKAM